MRPSDENRILSDWLHGYSRSEWAANMTRDSLMWVYAPMFDTRPVKRSKSHPFWTFHRAVVQRLLAKHGARVLCVDDDPDRIVGWACVGDGVVHYVEAIEDYGLADMARLLLEDRLPEPSLYTHKCPALSALPVPGNWEYQPIKAFEAT